MRHHILIVDDEPNVRLNYRVTLETEGFEVQEASDGGAALRELADKDFDLAILDMRMPEMDGLELLESMRERNIQTPVVIITAYGDVPHAVRAMKLGAIDFLQKPLTPTALRSAVGEILGRPAKHAAHLRTLPVRFKQRTIQPRRRLRYATVSSTLQIGLAADLLGFSGLSPG